jgi:hypothetical protein
MGEGIHPVMPARNDWVTIAAVAALTYAIVSMVHEGLGHGGACLVVGGIPRELSSMDFDCDLHGLGATTEKIVAAGGTIANLIFGLGALALYRRMPVTSSPLWRLWVWLFAAVNLMTGTGYFLFSGIGGIGDWAVVIQGLEPPRFWRGVLALSGAGLYFVTTVYLFKALGPLIGATRPERYRRALRLATVSYFAGGALSLLAGFLNPAGLALVAISGAAASFGGTSGLAWGPQMLRGAPTTAVDPPATDPPVIARSWPVVAIAGAASVVFILIFGRGVHFHS